MIEIELRYEILEPTALDAFLKDCKPANRYRTIDTYLDTKDIRLTKMGVYLRVRDQKQVDIKFNRECIEDPSLPLQPYCEEHTFPLPLTDIDAFNSIITSLGLKPITEPSFELFMTSNQLSSHRVVDKVRTTFMKDQFTITIDEVANLGTFLEIEYMADTTASVDEITLQMKALLLPLSLKPLQTGYDSLILRKQNYQEYLQSRFVMDEDKV